MHRNVPDSVEGPDAGGQQQLALQMVEALSGGEVPGCVAEFLARGPDPHASFKFRDSGGQPVVRGDTGSALRHWAVQTLASSGRPLDELPAAIDAFETILATETDPAAAGLAIEAVCFGRARRPLPRPVFEAGTTTSATPTATERASLVRAFEATHPDAPARRALAEFLGGAQDGVALVKFKAGPGPFRRSVEVRGDEESALRHYALRRFLRESMPASELVPFLDRASRVLATRGSAQEAVESLNWLVAASSRR